MWRADSTSATKKTDQVAEALNVSKPTLDTYFENKQEMLYECHRLAMDLGDQGVARMKAMPGTGLERILAFLEDYIRSLTSELGHFAVLTDYFALLPQQRDEILKRRDAFDREFRKVIEQGIEDGSIRNCDAKLAVEFVEIFRTGLQGAGVGAVKTGSRKK